MIKQIDDLVFKHLFVNSLLAISGAASLLTLVHLHEQLNWWSLAVLAIAIWLVACEDLLSWIRWQLNVEKCLKAKPDYGFWIDISRSRGKVKARVGSLNCPDKPIWLCHVFALETPGTMTFNSEQANETPDDFSLKNPEAEKARVYMYADTPLPSAIETENMLYLVKPPPRLSMLLIEIFEPE